jgi:hypothetical protein
MNKLSALSKLASAYHTLGVDSLYNVQAKIILSENFGYIRRSLRIEDLKPQPKSTVAELPRVI